MTTEVRDVHVHLTAQPGMTVHITVTGGDISVESDGDEAATYATSEDELLEAAIRRLEQSNRSPNIREAVDGLKALGYKLILPATDKPGKQRENYLRIIDPGYTPHGMGQITPTNFEFTRGIDRDLLASLPGAHLQQQRVAFSHVESAKPGLEAATMIKT
jgi:hypothetical protein